MKSKLIGRAQDVSKFASNDAARFMIQSIRLEADKVVATNGRSLIEVPYPANTEVDEFPKVNDSGEFEPCTVDCATIQEGLSKVPKNGKLEILRHVKISTKAGEHEGSPVKVQATTTDLERTRQVESYAKDGKYPDYSQVWPKEEPKAKIMLSWKELENLVSYAKANAPEKEPGITFEIIDELNPATFKVKLKDGQQARGLIMPMRIKD